VAYSEGLADRVRDALGPRPGVDERKMFGGIVWMVDGNMACGVMGDDLMVRLDRAEVPGALGEEHVEPMEMTGRRMGGFVVVGAAGIASEEELSGWVEAGVDYADSLPSK